MYDFAMWIEILIVIAWLGGLAGIKAYTLHRHAKPKSDHPEQVAEAEAKDRQAKPGEKKASLLDEYNNREFLENLLSAWFSCGMLAMISWATVMVLVWGRAGGKL